jgi:hypothetical protein
MQFVNLSKTRSTQLFWAMCGVVILIMILTGKQQDPGVAAAGVLLAIVSLFPFYLWMLGWSHGLPIWPVFAAANGIFAALPMVQAPQTLGAYSPTEVVIGGMTIAGFILLGSVCWLGVTGRHTSPPAAVLMISREHSERYLFAFIAAGLFFQANQQLYWIPLPGNTMQIVRGVAMSLNSMGIFVLAYYAGQGLLSRGQIGGLVALSALTALVLASNLILASAIVPVALLFLGYILGSGKLPWKSLALVLVVLTVLQPGKYAMRDLNWGGQSATAPVLRLPAFYWEWFGYGLQELGKAGPKSEEDEDATSLFERAGNIHMLLLVQKKSPAEVPFLNGITYEQIPRLMVPRFIDSEKGSAHAGNILLTVNYGVQSMEVAMGGTSIGWGLIPEAYANFGYLGVGAVAVFLGLFYGYFTRLSIGVPMTSLRFVIGLLIMAAATRADTMGLFVTSQFQAIVGVSAAAFFLMRRQPNPLAAESGETECGAGKWGSAYARGGYGWTSGMPAPGLLATLIEGSAQRGMGSLEVVPSASGKTAMRPTAWMPRALRMRIIADQREQAALAAQASINERRVENAGGDGEGERGRDQETKSQTEGRQRPRQVAVPYRNYRRYRG